MPIIPRPPVVPRWATDGGAQIIEPTEGKKNTGWISEEPPPFQFMNWVQNLFGEWTKYFDDTGELQTFNDDVVRNQVQVINFDTEFVTGNLIDMDLNTVAITQVPFNTDHLTTIGDLATEIQSNADVLTAIVNPDNDREVIITGNNKTVLIANISITGGASQAVAVIRESIAFIQGTVTPDIGQYAGRGAALFQNIKFVFIRTQTEFEKFFGKSFGDITAAWFVENVAGKSFNGVKIPKDTNVFMSPIAGTLADSVNAGGAGIGDDGTNVYNGNPAYVLKNAVELSSGVKINGAGFEIVNIIKNDADNTNEGKIKFYSNFIEQQTTGAAPGGATFNTLPNGTAYKINDIVHWSRDNSFYKVVATAATTVTVDRTITDIGGIGTLSSCIQNINLEKFSFDGRAGNDGLGGNIIPDVDVDGGAFQIPFIAFSNIQCRIINHSINHDFGSPKGGAISFRTNAGSTTEKMGHRIIAENIFHCFGSSDSAGGAIFGAVNSKLTAYYCRSGSGGTFSNCNFCELRAFYGNATDGSGGGMINCNFCELIYCVECNSGLDGGGVESCNDCESIILYNCIAADNGGGAINCVRSKIYANNCSATTGGGIFQCNNCNVITINCTASGDGGGCSICNDCQITAKDCTAVDGGGIADCDDCIAECKNCTASGNGGGAHLCSDLVASGVWNGNLATGLGDDIEANGAHGYIGLFFANGVVQHEDTLKVTNLN